MSKPGVKRQVFRVLVTAACVATGVALFVLTRKPVFILSPEPPEELALRQSADNAYRVMSDAAQLLPSSYRRSRPWSNDDEESGLPWVRPGQYGERSDSDRPMRDSRMDRHAEQWLPAAERAREALSRPHFRLPIAWSDCETLNNSWYPENYGEVQFLGRAMITEGMYLAQKSETLNEGVRWVLDALKLGVMLSSDGTGREGRGIQNVALERICELARQMDKGLLTATLAEVQTAERGLTPPVRNLEFEWRVLDNTRRLDPAFLEGASSLQRSKLTQYSRNLVFSAVLRQVRTLIAAHQDEFREALSLSYPRAFIWLDAHSNLAASRNERRMLASILGRNYSPLLRPALSPVSTLRDYVEDYARLRTWYTGTLAVLDLELYHQAHGSYPESLDALAPEFCAEVPIDPFSGMPFEYRAENGDYTLNSVGPVPNGGFGSPNNQYEVYLHRADSYMSRHSAEGAF